MPRLTSHSQGRQSSGLRGTGESRGVNLTLPRALPKLDHKGAEWVRNRGTGARGTNTYRAGTLA